MLFLLRLLWNSQKPWFLKNTAVDILNYESALLTLTQTDTQNIPSLCWEIAEFRQHEQSGGYRRQKLKVMLYGRGLGSKCYLTCLYTSCHVATFNVWLFNAWYSCYNWLYYIPFLLFAILLPCIWHLSFVHAGFSLCNALCHSSFYHYSYAVLPLFLLRHAIIASSMLTAIIHPDGASLVGGH